MGAGERRNEGPWLVLLREVRTYRIAADRRKQLLPRRHAWTIRSGNVIAIPESGSPAHVKENAVGLSLRLTPQELHTLDAAHPAPGR